MSDLQRIVQIALDEETVIRRSPDIEQERRIALYDLLEANKFRPIGDFKGPYKVVMGMEESRLVLNIRNIDDEPLTRVLIPLMPLRRIIKDYFRVCESYFQAIKTAQPSKIQAIDTFLR